MIKHERETPSKRRLSRHVVDSQNPSSQQPVSSTIDLTGPTPDKWKHVDIKLEPGHDQATHTNPRSPPFDLTGPTPDKWKTGAATTKAKPHFFIDLSNDPTDSDEDAPSPTRRKLTMPTGELNASSIYFTASGSAGWGGNVKKSGNYRRSKAGKAAAAAAAAAAGPSTAQTASLPKGERRFQDNGFDVALVYPEKLPSATDDYFLLPFLPIGKVPTYNPLTTPQAAANTLFITKAAEAFVCMVCAEKRAKKSLGRSPMVLKKASSKAAWVKEYLAAYKGKQKLNTIAHPEFLQCKQGCKCKLTFRSIAGIVKERPVST